LQELSSQQAYANVLGQLVCFYLRLSELDEDHDDDAALIEWRTKYPLKVSIADKLIELNEELDQYNPEDDDWVVRFNRVFHDVVYSFFCWTESRSLLEEGFCPVQRFLMVICLRSDGSGFINPRYITPLIAKLMYCIRACIFAELMAPDNENIPIYIFPYSDPCEYFYKL